jgi:hypothetical protein
MHPQVSAYIDLLDETPQEIAGSLRAMILNIIPTAEERYSFKIPFYHYFGMFCYINAIKGGIELAFCRGKDLVMAYPQLELGNRVMIAGVKLYSMADIQKKEVYPLIAGAAMWQQEAWQARRKFLREKKKQ